MVYRGSADRIRWRSVAKPDVQIFRIAEEKWGMNPANTYMVGDSLENDITGAKNAGWKTIWMNHHRYTVSPGMDRTGLHRIYRRRTKKISRKINLNSIFACMLGELKIDK